MYMSFWKFIRQVDEDAEAACMILTPWHWFQAERGDSRDRGGRSNYMLRSKHVLQYDEVI